MATKSIIGAEDDETEYLLFDEHIRRQREKNRVPYKRKVCSDEELKRIRLENLHNGRMKRLRTHD